MSKLDELIAELCPEGVEYRELSGRRQHYNTGSCRPLSEGDQER
jgi:hypothetical protein